MDNNYTYGPKTNTDDFVFDNNNSVDWNKYFNFTCFYLLPCGLCMRTNQQCPKHSGPTWTGPIWTNQGSSSKFTVTNTLNGDTANYTTGELKND